MKGERGEKVSHEMTMIFLRWERKTDKGAETSDRGGYLGKIRKFGRLSAELYREAAEIATCGMETIIYWAMKSDEIKDNFINSRRIFFGL